MDASGSGSEYKIWLLPVVSTTVYNQGANGSKLDTFDMLMPITYCDCFCTV